MILNLFSTDQFDINNSFKIGLGKIKKLPKFEKVFLYFWIAGPFIYLIERDPADFWMTTISIIFLLRCIIKKQWNWAGQLWFIFALLLWINGMISALLSQYDTFSFIQGLVWIRFPLYAAAAQIWLGKDRDIRMGMFV